jgi:hypothetical protein
VVKISLAYFKIGVLVICHRRASEGSKSFGEKYVDKILSFSLISPQTVLLVAI